MQTTNIPQHLEAARDWIDYDLEEKCDAHVYVYDYEDNLSVSEYLGKQDSTLLALCTFACLFIWITTPMAITFYEMRDEMYKIWIARVIFVINNDLFVCLYLKPLTYLDDEEVDESDLYFEGLLRPKRSIFATLVRTVSFLGVLLWSLTILRWFETVPAKDAIVSQYIWTVYLPLTIFVSTGLVIF